MGKALYRDYRPKKFAEVVGQEPITDTLSKAIKSGRISHAYLLTGPRGVGKTSVARILAHEANNLPYTDESIHLDIIEIDAASNRRIDEIRDIREKVHIAPTSAKYKIYIIDEVHMLTKEAFNALLKTLEEPPAHCIFILATTEAHKLPETIVSRTQRFSFKPVEPDKAAKHLSSIAKKEKIDVEPSALELLAQHGSGSFRDSISLLDQLSSSGRLITEQDVIDLLGIPPKNALDELVQFIDQGSAVGALGLLGRLRDEGADPALLAVQLSKKIRADIIEGKRYSWGPKLLKKLLEVSSSKNPFELLEITVIDVTQRDLSGRLQPLERKAEDVTKVADEEPKVHKEPISTAKIADKFSLEIWPDVLTQVRKRAASLYTALRLAQPRLEQKKLSLEFQFPFHKNKVDTAKQTRLISDIIEELSDTAVEVYCKLADKPRGAQSSPKTQRQPKAEQLAAINNIFGSAELLES